MAQVPPIPPNESERLAYVQHLCPVDDTPDAALDLIVALAAQHFEVPIALVSIVDERRQWFRARVGLEAEGTPRQHSFCAYAVASQQFFEVTDAAIDERFCDNPLVVDKPGIRFYAGMPLMTEDGVALGSLCVINTQPRAPLTAVQRDCLAGLARLVVGRIQDLRRINFIDRTSGLFNRARLVQDVEFRLLGPGRLNVVVIDVFAPKFYNRFIKALGHDFDQHVMQSICQRLQALLPGACLLYRVSATRLAFLDHEEHARHLESLLDTLIAAFRQPLVTDRIPLYTELGIGVLPLEGGQPPRADWLRSAIAAADEARESNHGWAWYNPAVDARQQRSFALLSRLAEAVRAPDQLRLVFQPRVSLADGTCLSAEALLRWRHPELGEISPAEFISLAERTALIRPLGLWVLNRALEQLAGWRAAGSSLKVSINVSAHDLENATFCNELEQLLKKHAVDPQRLEMEFTESALMRDPEMVRGQLARISRLGVEVAIDDFGAGYSNWAYLRELPASTVKLDQSFLRALTGGAKSARILQTMISLARELGYRVVAEGIETQEQYRLMREWGCDEGQGYFIARPMEADVLLAWLSERAQMALAEPLAQ